MKITVISDQKSDLRTIINRKESETILNELREIIDWDNLEILKSESSPGGERSFTVSFKSVPITDSEEIERYKNSSTLSFSVKYSDRSSDGFYVDEKGISLVSTSSGPLSLTRFLEALEILCAAKENRRQFSKIVENETGSEDLRTFWIMPDRLLRLGRPEKYSEHSGLVKVEGLESDYLLFPTDFFVDWKRGEINVRRSVFDLISSPKSIGLEVLSVFV